MENIRNAETCKLNAGEVRVLMDISMDIIDDNENVKDSINHKFWVIMPSRLMRTDLLLLDGILTKEQVSLFTDKEPESICCFNRHFMFIDKLRWYGNNYGVYQYAFIKCSLPE